MAAVVVVAALATFAAPAGALITRPVTVDGPSSSITEFGGAAVASDGSGGVVYLKVVGGAAHVFASRYLDGEWSAPMRVDADRPFEAGEPRIAAGPGGELLVVWGSPAATVHGRLRWALYSARLGRNAHSFGPSLIVDPNVAEGIGLDPSLSRTAPGQAIVAYRVITFDFSRPELNEAVQLRPGDVMADIRVARFNGDRWSRLGAINRNPDISMRPPTPTNGPQVGAGNDGGAVVAWQEPDHTGAARIWLRRVFGSSLGPVLEVSPASWNGSPVSADADAFSLGVTEYNQARVAFRVAESPGSALAGRLMLNSLPPDYSPAGAALTGAKLVDGGTAGPFGPPGVGVSGAGGGEGLFHLVFIAGSQFEQMGLDAGGALVALPAPVLAQALPGAEAVATASFPSGGVVAYPGFDSRGLSTVAVRQESPSGAVQTGLLSGKAAGPVSELSLDGADDGEAMIGFRQGEPGRYEIVGTEVSPPTAGFKLRAPKEWVRPPAAMLHWEPAPTAGGQVTYSVLLDGRPVGSHLRRRRFRPRPAQLGSGVQQVRVLATDGLGQRILSTRAKLRVDSEPPEVRVVELGRDAFAVRAADSESGLRPHAPLVRFGDGSSSSGRASVRHVYPRPGRYTILVRARDRVGNGIVRRFRVRAR